MPDLFHERQQFRQAWLWILIAVSLLPGILLMGFGLYQQLVLGQPFGNNPTSDRGLILVALVLAVVEGSVVALLWLAVLDVRVTSSEIVVRFAPFHLHPRRIAIGDVLDAHARTYDPLLEFGGWGIRYGFSNGWAWNVSGEEGVQLELEGGKRILIGSQRASELAAAITAARQ